MGKIQAEEMRTTNLCQYTNDYSEDDVVNVEISVCNSACNSACRNL